MTNVSNLKAGIGLAIETVQELQGFGTASNSMEKIRIVIGLSDNVMSITAVNWTAIKEQYLAMDAAGAAELKAYFKVKFDLTDDKVEDKIEKTFNWMIDLAKIVESGIDLAKQYG